MWMSSPPNHDQVRRWLDAQSRLPLSYVRPGITADEHPPTGFDRDGCRVRLGRGEDVYASAKAAIRGWRMFPTEMARIYWPGAAVEVGTVVGVSLRLGPMRSLNACRIVAAWDVDGREPRFGFAYGTLPDHLECGEERFEVTWNGRNDSVHYELTAVSRPRHPLARLGYWFARRQQARFRRLSALAMQAACRRQRPGVSLTGGIVVGATV